MQAGSVLVTRPWNGGPRLTLRVTPLATESPALACAAIAAAQARLRARLRLFRLPFKQHLSPVPTGA